ncbi:DUF294 nucleotidyltransferase-like domain-containing protein [Bacillus suaedae]|uniref:CBS domain-containing protein n=1 Tax=Halalkalibacter suaedae TaxID=2822140 RepID=A0A941AQI0_9BACI|nr:DUF294 nucleotidyltransferase-like domain-containing protein [Bacillus suaedae]MBP3952737.1 hypothetical protein [Bacillus suaedae]
MREAKDYTTYGDQEWNKRYQELYEERLSVIHDREHTSASLQKSHDLLIKKAVCLALKKTESEWGTAPTHFAFFLMGSGARLEQSFWSDQDHGIIFESSGAEEEESYFLHVGKEIVYALKRVGYEPCDGKVMASNPKWCRSYDQWEKQIKGWLKDNKWETLRYTLTFFDSRTLIGDPELLERLKRLLFNAVDMEPYLLERFTENTGRLRKGVGLFNQLLVETKGKQQGKFDFKQTVLFPYVNGLRLLAIEQHIYASSTIERFEQLPEKYHHIKKLKPSFEKLLEKRVDWQKDVQSYEHVHHLALDQLSQSEKKQLKEWIKEGHQLYQDIERIFKKGEST